MIITVRGCARCEQDHATLIFKVLQRPITDTDGTVFSHWAHCPTTGEPVLLTLNKTNPAVAEPCKDCEALREELLEERALNMKASGIEQERTADAEARVATTTARIAELEVALRGIRAAVAGYDAGRTPWAHDLLAYIDAASPAAPADMSAGGMWRDAAGRVRLLRAALARARVDLARAIRARASQASPAEDEAMGALLRCLMGIYIAKQRANDPACRGLLDTLISEAIPNAFAAARYEHPKCGLIRRLGAASQASPAEHTVEDAEAICAKTCSEDAPHTQGCVDRFASVEGQASPASSGQEVAHGHDAGGAAVLGAGERGAIRDHRVPDAQQEVAPAAAQEPEQGEARGAGKVHRCMRCGGEFACRTAGCEAKYDVLPSIVQRAPDGSVEVVEHECVKPPGEQGKGGGEKP